MWQLRRISTSEPLSEAGPLPQNWGPIFGLGGIVEKLGDLSWLGPAYTDQGWFELSAEEQLNLNKAKVEARVQELRNEALQELSDSGITVGKKVAINDYLLALDGVCRCPDFDYDPRFPVKPF